MYILSCPFFSTILRIRPQPSIPCPLLNYQFDLPLVSLFSFSFIGELWSSTESFRSAYTTLSPVMQQPCPVQARPILRLSNLSLERRSLRLAIGASTTATQKCATYVQRFNIHRRNVLYEWPLPPACPPPPFHRPPQAVRCRARHRPLLYKVARIRDLF